MQSKMSKHRSQLLASRAHAMRVAPTASERLLFEALRAAFPGVAFRRQVPLCGRFIADLAANALANSRKAVQVGDVQVLSKSIQAARSALAEAEPALAAAGDALLVDYGEVMRSGILPVKLQRLRKVLTFPVYVSSMVRYSVFLLS